MKKLLAYLWACLLLLTGCQLDPLRAATTPLAEGYDPLPASYAPGTRPVQETVTLYYRYLNEPFLAAEHREITLTADMSREKAIVTALLSGPDVRSPELTALFPAGVQVLSTIRQGRMLFVTLSSHIMDAYPDEPQDWADDLHWAVEAPLRRKLCMQSLAATITENCDVDAVQVLVEQSGPVTDGLRLRRGYYLQGGHNEPAEVLQRDDSLLLTPSTTLKTILDLWQNREWTRLMHYLTGSVSVQELTELPHLLTADFTGYALSADGLTATFTLAARVRNSGGEMQRESCVIRLVKVGGLWRMTWEQLTGWLEVQ